VVISNTVRIIRFIGVITVFRLLNLYFYCSNASFLVFVFITGVIRVLSIVMFIRLVRLLSVVLIIFVNSDILALQGLLRLLRLVPRQSDKHISSQAIILCLTFTPDVIVIPWCD
jgi:hypothetical protein